MAMSFVMSVVHRCIETVFYIVQFIVTLLYHVQVFLLQPVTEKGKDVCLIILPGAFVDAKQYIELAESIQASTKCRLWVCITGQYLYNFVNSLQVPAAIEQAQRSCCDAGMQPIAPVYVMGHSMGGVCARSFVESSRRHFQGVILLSSYPKVGQLVTSSSPVLTISGTLDGQTRIARIAQTYREVKTLAMNQNEAIFQYPVVCLDGVNHSVFLSGALPKRVQELDLDSDVSAKESRQLIAEGVSNFVSYHSLRCLYGPEATEITKTTETKLAEYFVQMETYLKPFLDAVDLETDLDKNICPWAIRSQNTILKPEESTGKVKITSQIVENKYKFMFCKPKIEKVDELSRVVTMSFIQRERNPYDIASKLQAPLSINIKMKTRVSVYGANNQSQDTVEMSSAKDINQLAWDMALSMTPPRVLDRFKQKNIQVIFEDDELLNKGSTWLKAELKMVYQDQKLIIRSPTLYTSMDIPLQRYRGHYYAKLLPVSRALEFLYTDCHRKQTGITL